jgi:oxalate decarboxylase/phosphoglucose isomerase-like protein (cupin superfamily)
MRKIDLKKTSGLNLVYDKDCFKFEKITYSRNKLVTLDDMREQILNEDLQSPEIFYTKYSSLDSEGVFQNKHIKINLIHVPSNVAGIEYVKTKATECNTHNKVVEIVSGGGMILIQNFSPSKEESTVALLKVKTTEKIIIPAKYSYSLINNRSTPLIVLEFLASKAKNKLTLDEMRGMAYYVIRKNAKQEIVRNPLYKIVNTKRKVDWDKFYKKCNITPKTPFSRQILRKYEKFGWLLSPAKDPDSSFSL